MQIQGFRQQSTSAEALINNICCFLEFAGVRRFLDADRNRYGSAYHRVIAHTDQAHHFHMRRYGRRTCELCVGMHTAQCIREAIGSGTCSHIVRMQRTSRAAAGCYGEVFLSCFRSLFLIGTCNRMLEPGRVRRSEERRVGKECL